MKILITGGTGLLGKALIETAGPDYKIISTYFGNYIMEDSSCIKYKNLDIGDKKGYWSLFDSFRPETVVHTAGISSPDFAELNKRKTRDINLGGTENMVSLSNKFGAKFIYISSNGIYDGDNPPYAEDDVALPINFYGQIKLEGEKIAKKSKIGYAIVRPILMYGWNHPFERPNILTTALEKLRKGKIVNVYDDVFCNPLSAEYCAKAIWLIIANDIYDIFNIAGKDIVSIYEFVKVAARVFGLDLNLVRPVQQGFFKELVKRGENTSYNTKKMERFLGLEPLSIKQGLEIMKDKQGMRYV